MASVTFEYRGLCLARATHLWEVPLQSHDSLLYMVVGVVALSCQRAHQQAYRPVTPAWKGFRQESQADLAVFLQLKVICSHAVTAMTE